MPKSDLINNLSRMYEKSRKEALKSCAPLISDLSTEDYEKLVTQKTDILMKIKLDYVDKALSYKNDWIDILKKHNLHTDNPEKLKENYLWITLRPSDDHKHRFAEFKQLVLTKYITRECFISYRYAWEQKGETPEDMGTGYHIHILALCPNWLKKNQVIKDTKSTFKKFFNGDVHDAFVDVEYVRTLEYYNNINAYMSGYKADDWKDAACAMDKPWRAKWNLLDSYGDLSSKSEA